MLVGISSPAIVGSAVIGPPELLGQHRVPSSSTADLSSYDIVTGDVIVCLVFRKWAVSMPHPVYDGNASDWSVNYTGSSYACCGMSTYAVQAGDDLSNVTNLNSVSGCSYHFSFWRNIDNTTSVDDYAGYSNTLYSDPNPPEVTTTVDNCPVIAIGTKLLPASNLSSGPTGYTGFDLDGAGNASLDYGADGGGAGFYLLDSGAAGAENPSAIDFTGSAQYTAAMTTALRPAS